MEDALPHKFHPIGFEGVRTARIPTDLHPLVTYTYLDRGRILGEFSGTILRRSSDRLPAPSPMITLNTEKSRKPRRPSVVICPTPKASGSAGRARGADCRAGSRNRSGRVNTLLER